MTSGVRIGTPAVTTRGMNEDDMKVVGRCIADIIRNGEEAIPRVTEQVLALCAAHPLYENDVMF